MSTFFQSCFQLPTLECTCNDFVNCRDCECNYYQRQMVRERKERERREIEEKKVNELACLLLGHELLLDRVLQRVLELQKRVRNKQ